jgi:formylglycine-generating enzyme required for sulfatase activity
VRADELEGDCAGATHFVYGATVGAFDFYEAAAAEVGGGANVGPAGAGAQSKANHVSLTHDGTSTACSTSTIRDLGPPQDCGAIIRVEVVPLGKARTAAEADADAERELRQSVAALEKLAEEQPVDGMVQIVAPPPVGTFWLDRMEVTTAAYDGCIRAGRCTEPRPSPGATHPEFCNWGNPQRGWDPVNCVDWNQASQYCTGLGKRLPSDAEWTFAATGGDGRPFPWGTTPPSDQLCWQRFDGTKGTGTCPVGLYPAGASPFGVLDMAGNVWEWTSDATPKGERITRGGSWADGVDIVRTTARGSGPPSQRVPDYGFRCAR